MVRFSHVCCMMCAVRFIRVSQVKCLLPFQALAQALTQNSTLTKVNLKHNNIGDEGAKAWCLVTMVS